MNISELRLSVHLTKSYEMHTPMEVAGNNSPSLLELLFAGCVGFLQEENYKDFVVYKVQYIANLWHRVWEAGLLLSLFAQLASCLICLL